MKKFQNNNASSKNQIILAYKKIDQMIEDWVGHLIQEIDKQIKIEEVQAKQPHRLTFEK